MKNISQKLKSKYQKLQDDLVKLDSVVVAFSGGVDSTFLLKVAKDVLDDNVLAVTVHSKVYLDRDFKATLQLATKIGVEHLIITSSILENMRFRNNTYRRCYYCKKQMFSEILSVARKRKFKFVIEASNKDDEKDFRPGLKALDELGILSPLRKGCFSKDEIRIVSQGLSLETHSHLSSSCLATRIPYGIKLSEEILSQVDKAENYLFKLGFTRIRVRYHKEVARIEIEPCEFQKMIKLSNKIVQFLKKLGFTYIAVDLEGYRSGSLNLLINEK
ncbi:MAG: ATP-dependent sacrificial sulfur transferase LarE [Candidatus Saelkia tenebricola]|nr:ATP-dependent sacrificial sulfur transferase LarE [Candidatus Saelkia tenebricola]